MSERDIILEAIRGIKDDIRDDFRGLRDDIKAMHNDITSLKIDLKAVEYRHDNCPGETAIDMLDENKKRLETIMFFSDKPKMFLYMIFGFVAIGGLSVLLSYGTVKFVQNDKKQPTIQIEKR